MAVGFKGVYSEEKNSQNTEISHIAFSSLPAQTDRISTVVTMHYLSSHQKAKPGLRHAHFK